jgi:hypothetical protein
MEGVHAFRENRWFTHDTGNWNVLSNAPLVAAALALAGESPRQTELAAFVFDRAISGLASAVGSFEAGSGVWLEGPGEHFHRVFPHLQSSIS